MRSYERRRVYLILGIATLILAAVGVFAHVRLTSVEAAIDSRASADEAQDQIARVRLLLAPPAPGVTLPAPAAAAAGPPPSTARDVLRELDGLRPGIERLRTLLSNGVAPPAALARDPPLPERPDGLDDALARELQRLAALLAAQPAQQERLERLGWLARKLRDPMTAAAAERPAVAEEIAALLARIEATERERHARVHAQAIRAEVARIAWGTSTGVAALAVALLAAGLVRWEVARRRSTRRRVAGLVEAHRALAERLARLEGIDRLTGLANRHELLARFEERIREARARSGGLAVVVADVNRFEHLNAMFGFDAGDEALKQTAARLRALAGDAGIVARLGGGEFAVVQACGGASDAAELAERVRLALTTGSVVGGKEVFVTANAGVACYPDHGADASTLLGNAELARTRARGTGRNHVQVFDEALSRTVTEGFKLERALFAAQRKGEYDVLYQPYWELESREVMGAEALLRWRQRSDGAVPASRFIPVLEETGLILDVGRWVLETSCAQLRAWEARKRVPLSVNLSAVQFRDRRLTGTVSDAISHFKLHPEDLTLEVTESACVGDLDFAARTLKGLKDLGVSISIDDFGTGYSSLSYLKRLPVDNVKIDISFVRDVATDQDSASIISAIATLARSLKLRTIAEGVESEDQRKVLHLLRCDMGQGFFFSPAVPAAELEALVAKGAHAPAPVPA